MDAFQSDLDQKVRIVSGKAEREIADQKLAIALGDAAQSSFARSEEARTD